MSFKSLDAKIKMDDGTKGAIFAAFWVTFAWMVIGAIFWITESGVFKG